MKPEPSELVLRGCRSPLLSPPLELPPGPPRRFLKKSSKNSSNGEPGGSCGIAPLPSPPPLASTVCEVEMLTTASITFSATSAMPSGPRARACTDKNGADITTAAVPRQIAALRSDAARAQDIVRRHQRALHGPAHPGRACREHQAFKHKQNAHTDEEVGERYGPHRIGTSRLCCCFLTFRPGEAHFARPCCRVWAKAPCGSGAAGGGDAAAAAAAGPAGGLPEELPKNLKKSESGRS